MKALFLALSAICFVGCSSAYKTELLDRYPRYTWSSKLHQGLDSNYDRGQVWLESKDKPNNEPRFFQGVYLPFNPNVVHAYPGRYFYIKKGERWHHFKFNDSFDDIEHLEKTDYVNMFSWGNDKTVVGGLKSDGSMDLLSTFNGKLIANLKDVDTKNQPAKATSATFVRMKDGTYKVVRAQRKLFGSWMYYPTQYEVLPYTYYFGGDIQSITLGVRDVDGLGHVDIFLDEDFYDLSKNLEHSTRDVNKKYMDDYYKDKAVFNFGEHPEKRFVILRDGEVTPSEHKDLDTAKMKDLMWMSEKSGKAQALALMMKNDKGEPRLYTIQSTTNYYGQESRAPIQGTLFRSLIGMKDATASNYITSTDFKERPVVIGKAENDMWDWSSGTFDKDFNKVIGFSSMSSKAAITDKAAALKFVRETCASSKMTPEQIAKARADYEARDYAMAMAAKDAYAQAVRQDEYKRKMSEYLAQEQARQEFRQAMGSISSSLTKGATSNTPQGPRGFEDKYDSTGAGYNRYDKWVKEQAEKKARQK